MEINNVTINLLALTAKDLSKKLNQDKTLLYVKQYAAAHMLDNDEEVQIQVLITRDKDDFLEDFCTEEMRKYEHRG